MRNVSAILSSLHLLALAIGLPAIVMRARALARRLDDAGIKQVLTADAFWGVAAILWIVTGPGRVFGSFEKGTQYYLSSPLFWVKLALFALVFLIELAPMIAFIRWRIARGKGQAPNLGGARSFATLSWIQAGLVVAIMFVASFMARGLGRP